MLFDSVARFSHHIMAVVVLFVSMLPPPGQAAPKGPSKEPPIEAAIKVFPSHEEIGTSKYPLEQAIEDGRELFLARFTIEDGAGRAFSTGDSKPTGRLVAGPLFSRIAGPDANSCAGCHNQPETGGAGDFATNVFVGAHFTDPPVDNIDPVVTSERNTTDLFGTGAIELAAAEMTADLHRIRDEALSLSRQTGEPVRRMLQSKGVDFGAMVAYPNGYLDGREIVGIDYALIVRPFGVKGIAASLREFTIAALNQHHGIQAVERFGWERTGITDFDGDGIETEFTLGHVTALVLFQASLAVPNSQGREFDPAGLKLFTSIGCATCHRPKLNLESNVFTEPNIYNRPGTLSTSSISIPMELDLPRDSQGYYIEPFSDLRRHNMCDDEVFTLCNEKLRQDNVDMKLFITSRLWNLANTGPYCHRGDCSTINEAILAHGGDARGSRENYLKLNVSQRRTLISYLQSLGSDLFE